MKRKIEDTLKRFFCTCGVYTYPDCRGKVNCSTFKWLDEEIEEDVERENSGVNEHKLKPCPFCGGKAQLYRKFRNGIEIESNVICVNCLAMVSFAEGDNAKKTVDAWNRRVTEIPQSMVSIIAKCGGGST